LGSQGGTFLPKRADNYGATRPRQHFFNGEREMSFGNI